MASTSELFGEVRSLVNRRATRADWHALIRLVERWPDPDHLAEVVIPYLHDALDDWPESLRLAPSRWVEQVGAGELRPEHALADSWRWGRLDPEDFNALAALPEGSAVRDLQFMQPRGDLEQADALLGARFIPKLEALSVCVSAARRDSTFPSLLRDHRERFVSLRRLELAGFHLGAPSWLFDAPFTLDELTLEAVRISPKWLSELFEQAETWPTLTSLDLGHSFLSSVVRELAIQAPDWNLKRLGLARNRLVEESAALLANARVFSGIEVLDLSQNGGLASVWPEQFSQALGMRGLRVMKLGQVPIGDVGLSLIVNARAAENLEGLHIPQCGVTNAGLDALAGARSLQRLRFLDINKNYECDGRGIARLAGSPVVRGLQVLRCSSIELGELGASALAGSRFLNELEELVMVNLGLADRQFAELSASPVFGRLKSLRLDVNRLSVDGMTALSRSVHGVGLQRLALPINPIGDDGARVLARSENLGQLESLDIRGCQVGDAGVAALASSTRFAKLRELGLGGNLIGASGFAALKEAPWLPQLEELTLWGHQSYDDAALGALDDLIDSDRISARVRRQLLWFRRVRQESA